MLSRIHVYAASLGLLLAGPAVALCQSSIAVMLDRASAANKLPTSASSFPQGSPTVFLGSHAGANHR